MGLTSIAIIDDHPTLRDGLASLVGGVNGYAVAAVGTAASEILSIAMHVEPDVMLVDLQMPGDVLKTIVRTRGLAPETKIVMFTASDRVDHVIAALDAGADGYVLKGSSLEELLLAVEDIKAGKTYVSPSLSSKMIQSFRQKAETQRKRVDLSLREEQIIRFLSEGLPNKTIAIRLNISEKTVKHYMTGLIQKLEARNRLEVVMRAQRMGLLPKAAMERTSNFH
ncbi:two-component response regulator [Fulvimarina pelagi HTCC2506]|uniref:Two-component response regulator n=2 Tax=Fulvimarina pelagi TaxID=217511 RepID=Q0G339_9HYPH|nr:response regulator transcription factor [Fulvimarina pelagi]EAU41992.1 two-component response regulator [Fulvimarina pelagi HTCC2506]BAT30968.1 two-component response regulator [Fulvimarina pelagi]